MLSSRCQNDIVLLVGSHDRYSAAWPPFCHAMRKYWPDCPWPIKFITNRKSAPCGESLKVGGGRDFSRNTKRALEQVGVPVVLWTQEEHWLTERPDTEALKEFAEIVLKGEANHIRLISGWTGKVRAKGAYEPDPRLLIFADDSAYRTSVHMGFWNVEVFGSLLRPGESVWEFETKGSKRSGHHQFLCVREHKYVRYVVNTKDKSYQSPYSAGPITKGKWSVAARKYAQEEGLEIDFSRNPDGTRQ
jgi:hypothetical protein